MLNMRLLESDAKMQSACDEYHEASGGEPGLAPSP